MTYLFIAKHGKNFLVAWRNQTDPYWMVECRIDVYLSHCQQRLRPLFLHLFQFLTSVIVASAVHLSDILESNKAPIPDFENVASGFVKVKVDSMHAMAWYHRMEYMASMQESLLVLTFLEAHINRITPIYISIWIRW